MYLDVLHLFLNVHPVVIDLGYYRFLVSNFLYSLIHLMTLEFLLTLQFCDIILNGRWSHAKHEQP